MLDLDRSAAAIESALARYNQQRIEVHARTTRARRLVHVCCASATAAIVVAATGSAGFTQQLITALILPLMLAYVIWSALYERAMRPAKHLAQSVRNELYPLMLDTVDTLDTPAAEPSIRIERVLPRSAVGHITQCDLTPLVSGEHRRSRFHLCRAHMLDGRGDGFGKTLFSGTILIFELDTPLDGSLVLAHEHSLLVGTVTGLLAWIASERSKVALPNPAHRLWTDNSALLTQPILERLCGEMDRLYGGQGETGDPPASHWPWGWVSSSCRISAGLQFALPDISKPMSPEQDVRPVARNTMMLLEAIDPLRGAALPV